MRVLGLRHDSVKRAIEIREAMVDSAAGWRWIKTKQHCDRLDWSPLQKWLHSDEASTPDNDHKTEIKVNIMCGEDDEAAKWEEKGRARLEQ